MILSLPHFSTIYFTILCEIEKKKRERQLREFRTVTSTLMCRDECFLQSVEKYYGAEIPNPPIICNKLCLSFRNKSPKVVKRAFLIDHFEVVVFDEGSVTLGLLA